MADSVPYSAMEKLKIKSLDDCCDCLGLHICIIEVI